MTKEISLSIDSVEAKQNIMSMLVNLEPADNLVIEIKRVDNPMTDKQRRSFHKYLAMLAVALNDSGWDMRKVLAAKSVDVPWTTVSAKEVLWKPVLKAMTGKTSTTKQDTKDVSKVYEILNRHTSENLGVSVPFPDARG